MFCRNCGKSLDENARFCGECGAVVSQEEQPVPVEEAVPEITEESPAQEPVCEAAPAEEAVSEPSEAEAVEETLAEETPAQEPVVETAPTAVEAAPIKGKKGRGKAIGLILAVVVILALVAAVAALFLSGGEKTNEYIAYVNDDHEMMFLKDSKEKTEAVELSDETTASSWFEVSPDGKYVYFKEFDDPEMPSWNENTLMRMKIAEIGDEGVKAEKVDSDVNYFWFLDNGDLIYVKTDENYRNDIYAYDGEAKNRLAKQANTWQVDEESGQLYYTVRDDDDHTVTLYCVPLDGTGSKETLLKDADVIWSALNAEVLLYGEYTEQDGEEAYYGGDSYTVYSCAPGGEETELLEEVAEVMLVEDDWDGKSGFYYYTKDLTQKTLYDYVTDKFAAADKAVVEKGYPEHPDYPDSDKYDAYYLVDNDAGAYIGYETWYGDYIYFENGFTTTDWDEAVDLAISMSDIAWENAKEEYYAAAEAWESAIADYEAAQTRQYMREDLKNWDYSDMSYTLFKYENGESAEITAQIDPNADIVGDFETGIFLYQKVDTKDGKVADIEELDYAGEVLDRLGEGAEDPVWYLNVNGTESEMEFDTRDVVSLYGLYCIGDEVAIRLNDGEDYILECYTVKGSELTFRSVLSEECGIVRRSVEEKALYFWEDVDEETYAGDLIRYADGKSETLAKDTAQYYALDDGAEYILSDPEENDDGIELYELRVKQGDKWVTVNGECGSKIAFPDSKQAVYISDGDLYIWDGKESRRLAKDVLNFWAESVAYKSY